MTDTLDEEAGDQLGTNLSFLSPGLIGDITSAVTDALDYDNTLGSIHAFAAEHGFELDILATPQALIDGAALPDGFLRLRYAQTSHHVSVVRHGRHDVLSGGRTSQSVRYVIPE